MLLLLLGLMRSALRHLSPTTLACPPPSTGGRWRCLGALARRARLSLALLDQLDLPGRTGEMARLFGIDFFSVLSRGSQYRVEAMMARLAHSQNYLLPSPSKEEVARQVGSGGGVCAWGVLARRGASLAARVPGSSSLVALALPPPAPTHTPTHSLRWRPCPW